MRRPPKKRSRTPRPKYRHEYSSPAWTDATDSQRATVRMIDRASVPTGMTKRPPAKVGLAPVPFARCARCCGTDIHWVSLTDLCRTAEEARRLWASRIRHGAVRQCMTCGELSDLRQAKRVQWNARPEVWTGFGARPRTDDAIRKSAVDWEVQGPRLKFKIRYDLG